MKSSKAKPDRQAQTFSLPMMHEPGPGWSTTEPPPDEQFTRFEELTRRLVKVPKTDVDELREADK